MRRISLANLTVIGLTPPEMVALAAELGCDGIALNPGLAEVNLGGPLFRLDRDPEMRRETERQLQRTGLIIDLIDSLVLGPGFDVAEAAGALDVLRDLGARGVNIVQIDRDTSRSAETLAATCDIVTARGMVPMIEFSPLGGPVSSLEVAVGLASSGDYPGLKVLIDALHISRAGEGPADIAGVDPELIGAFQICDGPAAWPGLEAYYQEALFERGIPGEGELPLKAMLDALPADIVVSPEVPLRSLRDQGVPVAERARRVVEATRRLVEAAG